MKNKNWCAKVGGNIQGFLEYDRPSKATDADIELAFVELAASSIVKQTTSHPPVGIFDQLLAVQFINNRLRGIVAKREARERDAARHRRIVAKNTTRKES